MTIAPLPSHPLIAAAGRRRRWSVTHGLSLAFSAVAVLALAGMVTVFVVQSLPAWSSPDGLFPFGDRWYYQREKYGALSLMYGTVVVAAIAMLLAAPVAIGSAIFSAEFLPRRIRLILKLTIELFAGIPSIVYGLLGMLVLQTYVFDGLRAMGFDPRSGFTLLTGGILLSVMMLPTVMTLADDALRSVPAAHRHAARALGLTRTQQVLSVSLPQARRGIIAALLLAMGRALGEMIAVFLVVGRRDNRLPDQWHSLTPLIDAGQTMATKLGGQEINIGYGDPLHWGALVGLGLILLVAVSIVTLLGAWLEGRSDARL